MMDIGIDKAVACRWGGKITEDVMKLILSSLKEKIDMKSFSTDERQEAIEFLKNN